MENPETALVKPNSIVLTESVSIKYFGEDNPLGKTLVADGSKSYLVTGVMKDFPKKSHFRCGSLISLSTYPINQDQNWLDLWYTTYILLKKDTNPAEFDKKLKNIVMNYVRPQAEKVLGVSFQDFLSNKSNKYDYHLQPLTSIYLYSQRKYNIDPNTEWGNVNNSDIVYSYIFSAIAAFILLIAIFNFMNLATAHSERRAKEVGIRKTLGSDKSKLILQFITESVLTTSFAVILSIVLLEFVIPVFNNFVDRKLSIDYFNNPYTIPLLIIFCLVVGIIAGSYPAFYLSSFQPAHILKSALHKKRSLSIRSLLVIIQFAISITLITGTIIIKSQLDYIQTKDLGFNKEHLIVINNASVLGSKIKEFKNDILQKSNIISATASSLMFQSGVPGNGYLYNKRTGSDPVAMQFLDVDYDFIKTYQVQIKAGRFFSNEFSTDTSAVIVNQAAVEACNAKDPVGKELCWVNPPDGIKVYHIIGVIKDFNYESLHQKIRPLVLHLSPVRQASTILSLRVKSGGLKEIKESLEKSWHSFVNEEFLNCAFIDQNIERMYNNEEKVSTITTVFSSLAIFIACLGLFGLAAFVTEQRTKEIGVRKVLGASIPEIIFLISKEFSKWIILANIVAWPVAYFVMNNWLQNFAYRIEINWFIFIISGLVALIIALMTISFQTIRTAVANPVNSLRYE